MKGKKTYITSILTIIGAGVAAYTGSIDVVQAIELITPAIMAMTLRSAIK